MRPPNPRGCLLTKTETTDGTDYDCEYPTTLTCDQCRYGMGRKDPEVHVDQAAGAADNDE
jgi:hypothetical protein